MRAPIRHHAAAVFAIAPPVREMIVNAPGTQLRMIPAQRRRPQPQVPIQTLLRRLHRQVARDARPADHHLHALDLADAPVAHQFARHAKLPRRPLHRSRLEDALVLAHRLHHRAGLVDGLAQRLLAIDVLARLRRRDGDEGVPMIRRRDHHCVDVLSRQQFAEIIVGITALVAAAIRLLCVKSLRRHLRVSAARRIHVAHRHRLRLLPAEEAAQQTARLLAHADETQVQPGIRLRLRAPDARRQNERCRDDGGGSGGEKGTA